MKKTILNLAAIVMLLFVATAANAAGTVTFVKMLDGEKYTGPESNLATFSEVTQKGDGVYSFSITPADDYYLGDVTAVKLIDASQAQSRKNEPGFNPSVTIWSEDNIWSFELSEADAAIYDVEVTVNFYSKTDISDAVVTLSLPADGFTYTGEEYEPEVTLVKLGNLEIENDYYDVAYSNNTDAGTATVTVTGKDIYKGAATATFTIKKAEQSDLIVYINGWTYGEYNEEDNAPACEGYNEGTPTYNYADATAAEPSFSETVPTNAGSYIVKATIAETDNYAAAEATASFTIAKADINPSVDLLGWVYGNTPNTPTISDNTSNADVTYTYAVDNPDVQPEYTDEMPTVVGNYIVKAAFAETVNYNGAEATDTFYITKANLADVVIDDIEPQTYTGSTLTPAITVTFKGEPVDASEYNVIYSENENVGEATVMLTTKDVNFMDGETAPSKKFQIVAATVQVTAENQTVTYNGETQEFNNYEGGDVAVLISYFPTEDDREAGENQIEQAEVMNAGTYYVQLVSGDDNYTFAPVNVTFTIDPKSLDDVELWSEIGEEGIAYTGAPIVLGEDMYGLTDFINDESIDLVEDQDFTVAYSDNTNVGKATVTFTGTNNYTGVVSFTFDIVRDLHIVLNEERQWATYYAEENLQLPVGMKAYIVTGIGEQEVIVDAIDYIPQHVGVLLNYEGNIEEIPEQFLAKAYTDATQTFDTNLLLGTSTGIDVTTITDGTVYVLYNDEFVKTISGTIPAGRGYLVVETGTASAGARALAITIDKNATGIAAVVVATKADGKYYNLQGQRMAQPRKGLNIVDGKKMIVK